MSKHKSTKPQAKGKVSAEVDKIDWREQLYNGGECGPLASVQLPESMVTSLRGIQLDFDPRLYRPEVLSAKAKKDPALFSKQLIRLWLRRHPTLAKAERRISGQGIHGILWLNRPVEFENEPARQRWAAIVKVIQKCLPCDPDSPGICALTRPVGSINGKNGVKVRTIFQGEPVSADEVLRLFEEIRSKPFYLVATLLLGSTRVTPCPVCGTHGTRLDALDWVGKCYGHCGQVRIGQLFDVFLRPRAGKKGG